MPQNGLYIHFEAYIEMKTCTGELFTNFAFCLMFRELLNVFEYHLSELHKHCLHFYSLLGPNLLYV